MFKNITVKTMDNEVLRQAQWADKNIFLLLERWIFRYLRSDNSLRNAFSTMWPGNTCVWSSAEKLVLGVRTFSGETSSRLSQRHLTVKEFCKNQWWQANPVSSESSSHSPNNQNVAMNSSMEVPSGRAEAFAPPMTSIAAISNNLNLLIFSFNFSRCEVTAGIHNISHPRRTDKITK